MTSVDENVWDQLRYMIYVPKFKKSQSIYHINWWKKNSSMKSSIDSVLRGFTEPYTNVQQKKIEASKIRSHGSWILRNTWVFPKIGVPPNHPLKIGFSLINHPFCSTHIFGNTHMGWCYVFQNWRHPQVLAIRNASFWRMFFVLFVWAEELWGLAQLTQAVLLSGFSPSNWHDIFLGSKRGLLIWGWNIRRFQTAVKSKKIIQHESCHLVVDGEVQLQ